MEVVIILVTAWFDNGQDWFVRLRTGNGSKFTR